MNFSVGQRVGGLLIAAFIITACGNPSQLPVSVGFGPNPKLPPPDASLLPTVKVAKAIGWSEGSKPSPAQGLTVAAFATQLDHPRWLHVLPNGDVLVAESNAPERPLRKELFGIRGWVMGKVMKRAGAASPSANRISLLRDADGDGVP